MGDEARKNVMTVLPYGLDHDQGSFGRNLAKDLDTVALAMNKPMLVDGIVRMAPVYGISIASDCSRDVLLHLCLGRPARLIRGEAQVATRDKDDLFLRHAYLLKESEPVPTSLRFGRKRNTYARPTSSIPQPHQIPMWREDIATAILGGSNNS
jgi:hypothetical protein